MLTENYISQSLELHLFFGRIMKEHSLFLKVGFTSANPDFSAKAEFYKNEFENLLNRAVSLADGRISENVLNSDEIVTDFTLEAEKQTQKLTGIHINSTITQKELHLKCTHCRETSIRLLQVRNLNTNALRLLNGLISLKEKILERVLKCQMFTLNYPLLIEHILREAKLYKKYIKILESDGIIDNVSIKENECFWNQIMMEHALFIRGLLDPSETELFNSADKFAENYSALLKSCNNAQNKNLIADSLAETKKFRDFKTAGVKGIENCQIRSLILPLLADHVLREANHFIRILEN